MKSPKENRATMKAGNKVNLTSSHNRGDLSFPKI